MARVYATSSDLAAYLGYTPSNADQLLGRASLVIDGLLIGAWYDTDTDDLPTEPEVAEALEDATVAQAAAWAEGHGSVYGGGGYDQVQIGSVQLARFKGGGSANTAVTQVDGVQVAPAAVTALRVTGLLPVYPIVG